MCFWPAFRDDALELTKGFDLFVMSSTSEGMCTALSMPWRRRNRP
jgi:hypothetical protein